MTIVACRNIDCPNSTEKCVVLPGDITEEGLVKAGEEYAGEIFTLHTSAGVIHHCSICKTEWKADQ